jgi:integrase
MPTRERVTIEAFLDRWLQDSVQTEVRPRTYESYRDRCAWYIKPAIGKVKLTDLQPTDLQRLYSTLLTERVLAPKTEKNIHGVLRKALAQVLQWGLAQRNVATLVKAPKVEHREAQVLDREQVRALLAAAAGTPWRVTSDGGGDRASPRRIARVEMGGYRPPHRPSSRAPTTRP